MYGPQSSAFAVFHPHDVAISYPICVVGATIDNLATLTGNPVTKLVVGSKTNQFPCARQPKQNDVGPLQSTEFPHGHIIAILIRLSWAFKLGNDDIALKSFCSEKVGGIRTPRLQVWLMSTYCGTSKKDGRCIPINLLYWGFVTYFFQ
mgnify:CR=1 FL=1